MGWHQDYRVDQGQHLCILVRNLEGLWEHQVKNDTEQEANSSVGRSIWGVLFSFSLHLSHLSFISVIISLQDCSSVKLHEGRDFIYFHTTSIPIIKPFLAQSMYATNTYEWMNEWNHGCCDKQTIGHKIFKGTFWPEKLKLELFSLKQVDEILSVDEVVLGKRRDGKHSELRRAYRVKGDLFFCGRELLRRLRGKKWLRKWIGDM